MERQEKPPARPIDPLLASEKEKRHYCNNKALLAEMYKWRDSLSDPDPEKRGKPSEEMGRMLLLIAERISNHSFFRNYPKELKEDMQMYAIEKMLSGMKNFNFKYTNVFAYFTKACFNAFKTHLSKHYKQVNIKREQTRMAMMRLEADMPNSSMGKCLGNQFAGYDDDFGQDGQHKGDW